MKLLPSLGIPKSGSIVIALSNDQLPIGRKGRKIYEGGVADQGSQVLLGLDIPQMRGFIRVCNGVKGSYIRDRLLLKSNYTFPIWRECAATCSAKSRESRI